MTTNTTPHPDRTEQAQTAVQATNLPKKSYATTVVIVLMIIGVLLVLCVLYILFGPLTKQTFKKDWSAAFKTQPSVVKIPVGPTDGSTKQWDESNSSHSPISILGGNMHWLGIGSSNHLNNVPARVWYDGKLIASSKFFISGQISQNGEHYAFAPSDDEYTGNTTLYVDNEKSKISGNRIQLLGITDDGREVFYTCESCGNQKRGLWRNEDYLGPIDNIDDSSSNFLLTPLGDYCYATTNTDLKNILYSNGKMFDNFELCSPNTKYRAYVTSRSAFFGWTIDETLHIEGRTSGITENDFSGLVLDDNGKPSYWAADGTGTGDLVLKEKRYSTGKMHIRKLYFSPDRNNLLIKMGDPEGKNTYGAWYLNGNELTGSSDIRENNFLLTDNALYIYETRE